MAGGQAMDFVKKQLDRISQQMGALSVSQKMLAVALVAVMAMTVLYWGKYAATADSVAVLEQPFPPEQAARVAAELERQGIRATVGSDGRVMVPADRQQQAFAAVAYSRMLPSNSSASVDKIVSQMTLWDSSAKTEKLWNEKKEVYLAQTIARFPGVEEASVHIDPAERRSFSSPSEPRASINIRMRDGERAGKQLVLAAADTVVGAQSGLTRANVMVIIDGVSHALPDREGEGGLGPGEILGQKQEWEKFYVNKLRDVLGDIGNPMIGVAVELKTQRIEEEVSQVDPKNVISTPTETQSEKTVSTTPGQAQEAGAIPNVAPTGTGGSAGASSKTESEKSSFQNDYGKLVRKVKTPPGDAVVTSASVRIPRSHFVSMYRLLNPKAAPEVDEATLQPLIQGELDKIRRQVAAVTGLKDNAAVMVDYYVDANPPIAEGNSSKGIPVVGMVGSYGKEVALGVLALAALLMVSGIVKKGAGGVPAVTAQQVIEERRELERLNGADEVVGAAGDGEMTLEAMELDEETSTTQQIVSQVANMVKENPDGATSLVRRWLNRA